MNELDQKLQQAFGFTADDLRENRQGRLSARQAKRLRAEASQVMYLVLGALALIGTLALISFRASPGEILMLLSCLILPGLVAFAFTIGVTESAIRPGLVSKTSGLLHRAYGFADYDPPLDYDQLRQLRSARTLTFGRQAAYRIVVGDQEFRLNQEEYNALDKGYYTVYFVPTLHKIVSVQRLDPALEASADMGAAEKPKREQPLIIAPDQPDDGSETIRA